MKENVKSELFIQILYDNIAYNENLISDWGFSCIINIGGKNILFDTGAKGDILLNNMNKLSIDPKSIDYVFISHDHWDHTGGLEEFLKINNNVKVFLLKSFSDKTKQIVKDNSTEIIEVENEQKIFENIFTTGDMIGEKHEQSLIIETNKGNIIIAGCAHPNIVNIIRKAKKLSDNDVLLVAGGFHYL
ncbi:MBL fold metallo-hydrolase, partial [candidate division WOR-3 bacterium]|nr:MBL fold metallo-hydrolase [candidate division WOR-3 bacterium]